jgi:hypothetical protein
MMETKSISETGCCSELTQLVSPKRILLSLVAMKVPSHKTYLMFKDIELKRIFGPKKK